MEFLAEVRFEPFPDIELVLAGVAYEGAEVIHEKIRGLMEAPKTGNDYKHVDGTIRPASAIGEAPGINSKDLVGSFDVIQLDMLSAQIYSDIHYGNILQEKRDRPYTEPAIELAMPEIITLIENRIESGWL
ncbi:MAG: hypothetical protein ABWZ66_11815 [Pyrinomonadaceae bacterium]